MSMIRMLVLMVMAVFSITVLANDFIDPMKPPAFALKKYRLEKLKSSPASQTVTAVNKQPEKQWVLQSVIYSSDRKHAIVNDQLVKKGDKVDGARVLLIKPGSVRLSYKGKAINLSVNQVNSSSGKEMEYSIKKKSHHEKKI